VATTSSPESISEHAHALLRERPHTPDELIAALSDAGLELGADPHDVLFEVLADDNVPIGDRWVNLPSLLHGSRWWIDVPAGATDALPLDHGVEVILCWHWDETALLDGGGQPVGTVQHRLDGSGACLVGPDGWLADVAGGAAILTFTREGISVVPAAGDVAVDPALADAFHAAFDVEAEVLDDPLGDDESPALTIAEHGMVFVQAFVDHGDVLRTTVIPPLPVLLAESHLEANGDWIAPEGTDWNAVSAARRFHELHAHHELSEDDTTSVLMLLGACSALLAGSPDAFGPEDERVENAFVLAMALGSADVCRVFVHEAVEHGRSPDDLLRFSAALLEHVGGGQGCSGPEVVAAECLDLLDRTGEAIAALERAVAHDPHPRAHAMLAGFAADRGDAAEAARLLRAGNVTPEDARVGGAVWGEIQPFLTRPKPMAERNDPCPCGSGRKYKACHQGKETHPLRDRAAWLYRKGCRFVGEHMLHEHGELAMAFVDAAGGSSQMLSQVIDSELVFDLTLEELGGFRRFLERRKDLLPKDERELAALWLLADRSVFRVDETGPGHLLLTDLADDEQVRIANVRGDRLRTGGHVAARLLSVGPDLVSYFGYVPVPDAMTAELLDVFGDGDATAVAEALGRCFAGD
jgi:hypothetical protein